jgi:hypothetical protein
VRLVGFVAHKGKMRNKYKILVGKLEGKILFGRSECRCLDNIRMDLNELG